MSVSETQASTTRLHIAHTSNGYREKNTTKKVQVLHQNKLRACNLLIAEFRGNPILEVIYTLLRRLNI